MSFHEILIGIMAVFALLGGIDRILGSRFGLGPRFEEGILAMGTLGLAMIGIVCLAPVLARLLRPIVVPVYGFLGADPAMFAGTLLACDMGGASLARELALSPEAAGLGGILTGSMLGATVVFTIPVAMGLLRQEDRPAMAKGILCGIVAIPLGILAGGLTAGFPAAIVESLTGFRLIPGLAPISEGFETVGAIAIVLAGAFPLVYVITRLLKKPLLSLGKLLGINDTAAAGLVATLANSIAAFETVKDMDDRGKVVNIAFAVPAAFVFGDHLGFTAGFAPELLGAMIVGKLVGGIAAVGVALWMTKKASPTGELAGR